MHIIRAALFMLSGSVLAQEVSAAESRLFDRTPYYQAGATTRDDIQRVPVPAGHHEPEGSFVLAGGRLFDGTGTAARSATVVVEGKKITAILPAGAKGWPKGAKVYDVTGKTVMPGLIDLHTHITYVEAFDRPVKLSAQNEAEATLRGIHRMQVFVQSGVTSVRDLASDGEVPFALKRWQSEGRIAGPRVFTAGQLITGRGGHGTEGFGTTPAPEYEHAPIREASGPDEWRDAVRIQFKQGADIIKLASHYSQDEIDAAVAEAHALGLPVTVDAETQYIDMAIEAGVDCIEHPLPRSDSAIELMATNGIASVPTLVPYRYITRIRDGYFGSTSRRFSLTEDTIFEMLRKMKNRGIKMGIGTDLIVDWIKYMPSAYIDELKSFVAVGYSASEALVVATKTNAEILRMADRLGTVEVGKLADLIVVDGQPERNLDDLANVERVFVNGRLEVEHGRIFVEHYSSEPPPEKRRGKSNQGTER